MPITGIGTKFRRWNSTLTVWEELSEIKSIEGPSMSRETIDTTTLNTSGGYRTFIAGFRSAGTISLTMNFTRDAFDHMKADFESDVIQNYEIILPDTENTSLEFEGLVTETPLSIPEGLVSMNCKIQISGPVTVESGSGPSVTA